MIPIRAKGTNAFYGSEGYEKLPAQTYIEDQTGDSCIQSVWELSDEELEVVKLTKEKQFQKFTLVGGVLDGEAFGAEQAVEISKWPSREEQIAILLGQITGVGSKLSSQLLAGGANLASQIKQKWDKDGEGDDSAE